MKRRMSTEEITENKHEAEAETETEAVPLNNGLVVAADNEMDELDQTSAADKLRRFCYLGKLDEPVYVCSTLELNVANHFPNLRNICAKIKDNDLVECLSSVLAASNAEYLPRRNESLLVLAVYLSTRSNEKERTAVRKHFSQLVCSDSDLFQFTKYVKNVQKCLNRKTPFSRTVRKAVLQWYAEQPVDKLLHMWSVNEAGLATHRNLLYRCHYADGKFEPETMAVLRLLSITIKNVINWPDFLQPVVQFKELIVGIAKLRLEQKSALVVSVVKQLSLSFEHIPRHMLSNRTLMKFLIPIMSYEELLQSWPRFYNLNKRHSAELDKFAQVYMETDKLRSANVEPIRFLLQTQRIEKSKRVSSKGGSLVVNPPCFMYKVYKKSFGLNKAFGLRLQITLNVEMNYLHKSLPGPWSSIKYMDALVALAFGYYKCDPEVNVQFWYGRTGQLKCMPWTPQMSVDEAKSCIKQQKVLKIKQALTDVLKCALNDINRVYDVFLVIVSSATRGNPRQKSDKLCQLLDEYRQKRNANAKFIIMSLRQQHASMGYSNLRNENILEICCINEQTPRIIRAFAHGKFN